MVNIEWSFNAWTVGLVLFGMAGFYWVTKSDMKVMKENVVAIKADLKTMSIVLERLAVQSTRLDNQGEHLAAQGKLISTLESRIFELSKGQGFIQRDINGEYPR